MSSVLFIYLNSRLSKIFSENFRKYGYEVYDFYTEEVPYMKLSRLQKLENIFHRVVFKNKDHIVNINRRNYNLHAEKNLRLLAAKKMKFDFCFVIRGDLVPEKVLKYAMEISNKMVSYQPDGISATPDIFTKSIFFDTIFAFDPEDVGKFPDLKLKFATNCYFDDEAKSEKNIDFSYIGVNTENRSFLLENLFDELIKLNKNYIIKFFLKQHEFRNVTSYKLIMLEKPIDYDKCLEISKNSKVIVDLKREEHNGLSFRFFEGIFYKSKIITNNKTVKNYDFYCPNNIFITDFNNFKGLKEWIELPYQEIPHEIMLKYRFDYWIKRLLDKTENQHTKSLL